MSDSPFEPKPIVNCPAMDELKTGDLLFPREPDSTLQNLTTMQMQLFSEKMKLIEEWSDTGNKKIRDFQTSNTKFKNTLTRELTYSGLNRIAVGNNLLNKINSTLIKPTNGFQLDKALQFNQSITEMSGSSLDVGGLDLGDLFNTLLPIIEKEFPDLFQAWLDMTVKEFFQSPVGKLFLEAMGSTDVRTSFFVGHVGIVIREKNGRVVDTPDGNVFVMEGNITDYSHYRVAIHPYQTTPRDYSALNANEAKYHSQGERGWVNRRCALGQHVWAARLRGDSYTKLQNSLQNFVDQAKHYHGRPFGFFDTPTFGDDDRMYCAEYVYRVFKDQGIELDDKRTWGWMQDYLKKPGNGSKEQIAAIDFVLKKSKKKRDDRFFVLHPAALWHTSALRKIFNPIGSGDYAIAPTH